MINSKCDLLRAIQNGHRRNESITSLYEKHGGEFDNRYQFDRFYTTVTGDITKHVDDKNIHKNIHRAYNGGQSISSMLRDGILGDNGKVIDITSMGYTRYLLKSPDYVNLGDKIDRVGQVVKIIEEVMVNKTYTRVQLWNAKRDVYGLDESSTSPTIKISKHYEYAIQRRLEDDGIIQRDESEMGLTRLSEFIHATLVDMFTLSIIEGIDISEIVSAKFFDPNNIPRLTKSSERTITISEEVDKRFDVESKYTATQAYKVVRDATLNSSIGIYFKERDVVGGLVLGKISTNHEAVDDDGRIAYDATQIKDVS